MLQPASFIAMHAHDVAPPVRASRPKLLALAALLLLLPMPSLGDWFAMIFEPTRGTPVGWAIYCFSKAWVIALPLVWLLFVERGRVSLSPARRGGLAMGVIIGIVMAIAIIAAYFLAGTLIDFDAMRHANTANGLTSPLRYVLLVVPLALVNSLMEEYVWRWFVFRKCEVLMRSAPAVIVSGLLFAGHHVVALAAQTNWNVVLLATLGVFLAGTIWSWCYLRYRSIWPGYVSHIIADVGVYIVGWMVLFGT